jgi:hypothetical protein
MRRDALVAPAVLRRLSVCALGGLAIGLRPRSRLVPRSAELKPAAPG